MNQTNPFFWKFFNFDIFGVEGLSKASPPLAPKWLRMALFLFRRSQLFQIWHRWSLSGAKCIFDKKISLDSFLAPKYLAQMIFTRCKMHMLHFKILVTKSGNENRKSSFLEISCRYRRMKSKRPYVQIFDFRFFS